MKKIILFFIFLTIDFAVVRSQIDINFIETIQEYKKTVKLTCHSDCIDTSTFNIKTYMAMYSAIKIGKKRYVFDYYYYYDNFSDGWPYIYVKNKKFNLTKHVNKMADERSLKENERVVFILRSLHCFLEDPLYKAKKNIYPIDTKEGYLQYLYFYEFGELFALKWHANYKSKHVINTKQEIEEILSKCTEQIQYIDSINNGSEFVTETFHCDTALLQRFLLLDFIISIQFNVDNVIVKWLEFEDWRGVFEKTYKIMRTKPYHIELMDEKRLVEIQKHYVH